MNNLISLILIILLVACGQVPTPTPPVKPEPASFTLSLTVVSLAGGQAVPADFQPALVGSSTIALTSGQAVRVEPGHYRTTLAEVKGYKSAGFSGDCTTDGGVSLTAGQKAHCFVTLYQDLTPAPTPPSPASLTVSATVINLAGGTATANDFRLTLSGRPIGSGQKQTLEPGVYPIGYTLVSGYRFAGYAGDCENGSVSLSAGQAATCLLTFYQIPPTPTPTETSSLEVIAIGIPSAKVEVNGELKTVTRNLTLSPVAPGVYKVTSWVQGGYKPDTTWQQVEVPKGGTGVAVFIFKCDPYALKAQTNGGSCQ